jgi:hypothetical protein
MAGSVVSRTGFSNWRVYHPYIQLARLSRKPQAAHNRVLPTYPVFRDSQYLIVLREERPFGLEIQVLRTGDGSAQYRWSYVVGWVPRRTYVTPHHPDLVLAVGGVPVVYHLRTGERTYWQLYGSAYRADISPNGNYAIVCGQNLHLYRFPEGIREWSTDSNDGMRSVIDASFLADGAHVVSLEEEQTGTRRLVKRRVSDGTAVWATAHEYLHLRGCIVGSVAVTALYHGRTVVVSSPRGIWEHDVATGEVVRKWNGHQGFVQGYLLHTRRDGPGLWRRWIVRGHHRYA